MERAEAEAVVDGDRETAIALLLRVGELVEANARPGNRDIVTPEHAVEMFRTIPGTQLCVVPNAGHGAMPKETVLTFLQEEATSAQ